MPRIQFCVLLILFCAACFAAQAQPIFKLEGNVKDVNTNEKLVGIKVRLVNQDLGTSVSTVTDSYGNYLFELSKSEKRLLDWNTDYLIVLDDPDFRTAKGCGYYSAEGTETTKGVDVSTAYIHDFALYSFNCSVKEVLPVLAFQHSCELESQHKDSLDKAVIILEESAQVTVRLVEYSASKKKKGQGSSCTVAEACRAYLLSKGVNPERIKVLPEVLKPSKKDNRAKKIPKEAQRALMFEVLSERFVKE